MDKTIGPKPSSFKLNYLDGESCKADEINVINKLVEAYHGQNCYLADFFTQGLLSWIESQIKNDFPVNLYQDFLDQAEENREMETSCHNQAHEITRLQKSHDDYVFQSDEMFKTLNDNIRQLNKRDSDYSLNESALNEMIREQRGQISSLEQIIKDQDQTINNLKARLFDIMEAK